MKKVVPFTKVITFRTMIAEITDIEASHTLSLKESGVVEGDILIDGKYKMTDASQIEEEFHYKLPFTIDIDEKYNTDVLDITVGDFYFEIINEEDLKINVEINLDGLEEKKEESSIQEELSTTVTLEDAIEVLEEEKVKDLARNDVAEEVKDSVRNDTEEEVIPIPIEVTEESTSLEVNPLEQLEQEIKEDLQMDTTEDTSPIYEQTQQEFTQNNMSINVNNQELNSTNNVSSIFASLSSSEETFSTYYVYIMRETDTLEGIMDKYKVNKELLQDYNDLSDIKVGSKLIIPCNMNE